MNYELPYRYHILPKKSLKKCELYLQKQARSNRNLLLQIHFPLRFFESPDSFHQKEFFARHNFEKIHLYTKIQSIQLINSSFSLFIPSISATGNKISDFSNAGQGFSRYCPTICEKIPPVLAVGSRLRRNYRPTLSLRLLNTKIALNRLRQFNAIFAFSMIRFFR